MTKETINTQIFHHSLPVQIRFNDIDALGHVNNTVYFSFFDLGKARYFEAVKHSAIDLGDLDIVVANINVNFFAPISFKENIEVKTRVTHIGNTSFKVHQILVNRDTSQVKCECTTIMVGFDVKKQCAGELSRLWIDKLCDFEGMDLTKKQS